MQRNLCPHLSFSMQISNLRLRLKEMEKAWRKQVFNYAFDLPCHSAVTCKGRFFPHLFLLSMHTRQGIRFTKAPNFTGILRVRCQFDSLFMSCVCMPSTIGLVLVLPSHTARTAIFSSPMCACLQRSDSRGNSVSGPLFTTPGPEVAYLHLHSHAIKRALFFRLYAVTACAKDLSFFALIFRA